MIFRHQVIINGESNLSNPKKKQDQVNIQEAIHPRMQNLQQYFHIIVTIH